MKCINPLRYKIGLDNYDQFKPLIISFFKRRAVFRRTEKIFKNRIYSTKIFCLNKRGSIMAINIIFYFCFFDLTINMFTIEQPKQKKLSSYSKIFNFFREVFWWITKLNFFIILYSKLFILLFKIRDGRSVFFVPLQNKIMLC